jgi:hypothetical protein
MTDFDLSGMCAPLSDAALRAIRDAIAKELERREAEHRERETGQARPRPPRAAT